MRSKRIGTPLLSKAELLAAERGCDYIGLGVATDNPRARSLYESLGYEDAGIDEYTAKWQYIDGNGKKRWHQETNNYLTKKLTQSGGRACRLGRGFLLHVAPSVATFQLHVQRHG